ncbi:MAG: hypothetical protein ACOC2U_03250, partial [bacterium]
SIAPFTGICSIRNIINMLNRDINVILINDSDLVKLRNSIIFYNEYFCPSEENTSGYKPAPIAFERIESKYNAYIGKVETDETTRNPFKNNLLEVIDDHYLDDMDSALEQYLKNRKKEETSIRSSKYNKGSKPKEKVVPLYVTFSKNIPRTVDLENFEWCFEDCEYLD